MGANREAIAATVDLLVEVSRSVSVSVPLADFGDWLDVLGYDQFYVSRRGDTPGELHVHATGFSHKVYVAVDTRAAEVVGHEVPQRDADRQFLDLPRSEVANLRAGDR